jgi:hypothetical protein
VEAQDICKEIPLACMESFPESAPPPQYYIELGKNNSYAHLFEAQRRPQRDRMSSVTLISLAMRRRKITTSSV